MKSSNESESEETLSQEKINMLLTVEETEEIQDEVNKLFNE
jgi:hypothetical protein